MLKFSFLKNMQMCLMCAHVAHQEHGQNFEKKCRILMDFRKSENFLKNFPKFLFVKSRRGIISFQSRARLSKIELLESILEHFEIFRFLKIFRKNFKFSKFEQKNNFKFQNALKSRVFNILD